MKFQSKLRLTVRHGRCCALDAAGRPCGLAVLVERVSSRTPDKCYCVVKSRIGGIAIW